MNKTHGSFFRMLQNVGKLIYCIISLVAKNDKSRGLQGSLSIHSTTRHSLSDRFCAVARRTIMNTMGVPVLKGLVPKGK